MTRNATPELLLSLQPMAGLSAQTARELAAVCPVETVPRNLNPFRLAPARAQSVYLIKGQLKITHEDGSFDVLVGGTGDTRRPLPTARLRDAKAITDIELIRIDNDVLDIMLTWDQLLDVHAASAQGRAGGAREGAPDWRMMSGMYAAQNLVYGVFASLPPAHIDELLRRFERVKLARGAEVIREGGAGDYYYLIESGRCTVTRNIGGDRVEIAELKPGDAFGEEALVADTERSASVTMKTAGVLLRLAKRDFVELLRTPLLHEVDLDAAQEIARRGGVWLDVRFQAEHLQNKLAGALNIPLNEIRNLFGSLDRGKEYIVYCQSGRRSSAAAFLLSQRGYRAWWLKGGLQAAAGSTSGGS